MPLKVIADVPQGWHNILERWGSALAECLRSGDLREDRDADEIASQLIEAWEGAALRGKMIRSRIPYDRFEADTVPGLLAGGLVI